MTQSRQKVVVITGGASGIGLAMTQHFAGADAGSIITVLDVNEAQGPSMIAAIAKECPQSSLSFAKCDVSSFEQLSLLFKEVFEEHGNIDIVMANAGISEQGKSDMIVLDDDEPSAPRLGTINVNFVGVLNSKLENLSSGY